MCCPPLQGYDKGIYRRLNLILNFSISQRHLGAVDLTKVSVNTRVCKRLMKTMM